MMGLLWIVMLIVSMVACLYFVKAILRKVLKIKGVKEKVAKDHYVNERHRKIDQTFKNYALVVLIIVLIIALAYIKNSFNWILIGVSITTFTRMCISIYFEWKYAEDPKQYLLTIADLCILGIGVIVILQFNFFA